MIKIALPNKGQLFEATLELLNACGYNARKNRNSLSCIDSGNNVEFYFLRPVDIPMYVGKGIIDAGITGLDFNAEIDSPAENILDLHYGHSRLCAAIPNESKIVDLDELKNLRIATSFGGITRRFFNDHQMKIVPLEGAVEISVKLGVSDAVIDVVETGTTIKQAGLKIIGEPLFHSNAALFAHPERKNKPEVIRLQKRIRGYLVAIAYMMVEYDVPKDVLENACLLTPGIESPTVTTLKDKNWYSVKAMVKKDEVNLIMDELSDLGCKGIIMTKIESARI
ncbi:MAG: ATP phosphoribosyltransferase [Proteobacteria bacterium]|nr:ATP phosphoribosyltransferase [Pseudomonadota bacterium]